MSLYCMLPCNDLTVSSSNIDGSLDPAQWTPGSHNANDEVSYGIYIYKASQATTGEPSVSADWVQIGTTNQYGFMDEMVVTKSIATAVDGSIALTVKGSGNYLALLGVEADSVSINGQAVALQKPVTDMWQYYTAPIEYNSEVSQEVLFRTNVDVLIERTSNKSELGKLIVARQIWMGNHELSPDVDMTDYSVIERDKFGYITSLQQRGYVKDMSGSISVETNLAPERYNQLLGLRGIPALYIDKTLRLMTYGILRRCRLKASNHKLSQISYSIEGLL